MPIQFCQKPIVKSWGNPLRVLMLHNFCNNGNTSWGVKGALKASLVVAPLAGIIFIRKVCDLKATKLENKTWRTVEQWKMDVSLTLTIVRVRYPANVCIALASATEICSHPSSLPRSQNSSYAYVRVCVLENYVTLCCMRVERCH